MWLLSLLSCLLNVKSVRGFKALKQSTKLLFLGLRRPNDALKTYTELLTYTKSAVTRNYSEKTINGILDYVGGGKGGVVEVDVLEKFYQVTKKALEEAKNEVRRVADYVDYFLLITRIASLGEDKFETSKVMVGSEGVRTPVKG